MTIDHTTHDQLERSLEQIDWAAYTQRAYVRRRQLHRGTGLPILLQGCQGMVL
ncbi:MAG: hypothetical protein Q8N51_03125 [Gammaproteobacteria bacterium]|nr:hypothetical protein [Gammaproteobacteria bacterium]